MDNKEKILKYLEQNAKYTSKNIADALSLDEKDVKKIIADCEADGTILGYNALIKWDKTRRDRVVALIEVSVQPEKGEGFDQIAANICAFSEVESVYLMSGGFDLTVILSAKSMKDVARFVFDKLALIDGVKGTATHFVLNKYKDKGIVFDSSEEDPREMLEI